MLIALHRGCRRSRRATSTRTPTTASIFICLVHSHWAGNATSKLLLRSSTCSGMKTWLELQQELAGTTPTLLRQDSERSTAQAISNKRSSPPSLFSRVCSDQRLGIGSPWTRRGLPVPRRPRSRAQSIRKRGRGYFGFSMGFSGHESLANTFSEPCFSEPWSLPCDL